MFLDFIFRKRFRKRQLKAFISVGAGTNQLPLINAAKDLGYHVIGIDQDTSSPGLQASNIKIQESIFDQEEIYTKIRELLIDGEIHAALTRSYGDAVRTTAYLCEKLGISYIPYNRVDDLINKKRMKSVFRESGILSPSFKIYSSRIKKIKEFPCIIKPFSGHGKTNVKLIYSGKELADYLKSVSGEEQFLIEEYIEGDEIISIGLVSNGKFRMYSLSDKELTPPPHFVDICHISPSKYSEKWNEIEEIGQQIADAFEITSSPLLFESRIGRNGKIYVIEAAPEFGGEYICDIMIPDILGTNIFRNAVRSMADIGYTAPAVKKTYRHVVIKYLSGESGYLNSYEQVDLKNYRDSLLFFKMFRKTGSKVSPPKTNHDRIGVVITHGKTREAALAASEDFISDLNISITKNRKTDTV